MDRDCARAPPGIAKRSAFVLASFVGQTLKQVYVLASQYWGEGPGAQELLITRNRFEAQGHNFLSGFFALDMLAEAANFPNAQDEPVTYDQDGWGGSLGPRQYPVTIHDATNVFFDEISPYSSWLPQVSCDDSIMLSLSTPSPAVSPFAPIACRVAATSRGWITRNRSRGCVSAH
jgi:hypothetical protein